MYYYFIYDEILYHIIKLFVSKYILSDTMISKNILKIYAYVRKLYAQFEYYIPKNKYANFTHSARRKST